MAMFLGAGPALGNWGKLLLEVCVDYSIGVPPEAVPVGFGTDVGDLHGAVVYWTMVFHIEENLCQLPGFGLG